MGEIQSTINQALALGAIGSGKFAENQQKVWETNQQVRMDDITNREKNVRVMEAESPEMSDEKKTKLLENLLYVNRDRLELATEAEKYIGKKGYKNPDKYEFYRNMYNRLIDDAANSANEKLDLKISNKLSPGQYFEQQLKQKKANEMNNMQQASQAMNKVNEKTQFNNYRKENSKQRTEAIKNKENKAIKNKENKASKNQYPTMEGLEYADKVFKENNLYDKKENK